MLGRSELIKYESGTYLPFHLWSAYMVPEKRQKLKLKSSIHSYKNMHVYKKNLHEKIIEIFSSKNCNKTSKGMSCWYFKKTIYFCHLKIKNNQLKI